MRADDAADLALLETAVREAGALAAGYFARRVRQWSKADDSPVTEADMAVDALLRDRLMAARPDYGWLSEEHPDDGARLGRRRVFVVDPIDGTRAFIDRETGWVISEAVVEDGRPVAGVLLAPARGELWSAAAGGGARLNGEGIAPAARADIAGARIAASKASLRLAGLADLERGLDRRFTKSLAFRLARVADATYDAALASAAARDWDLAAAVLVVQEAGGRASGLDGTDIVFNRPDVRHPPLIAAGLALHAAILSLAAAEPEPSGQGSAP